MVAYTRKELENPITEGKVEKRTPYMAGWFSNNASFGKLLHVIGMRYDDRIWCYMTIGLATKGSATTLISSEGWALVSNEKEFVILNDSAVVLSMAGDRGGRGGQYFTLPILDRRYQVNIVSRDIELLHTPITRRLCSDNYGWLEQARLEGVVDDPCGD